MCSLSAPYRPYLVLSTQDRGEKEKVFSSERKQALTQQTNEQYDFSSDHTMKKIN